MRHYRVVLGGEFRSFVIQENTKGFIRINLRISIQDFYLLSNQTTLNLLPSAYRHYGKKLIFRMGKNLVGFYSATPLTTPKNNVTMMVVRGVSLNL